MNLAQMCEDSENMPIFQDVNLNDISEDSLQQPLSIGTFDFPDLNIAEIIEKVGSETLIVEQVVPVASMDFEMLEQMKIMDDIQNYSDFENEQSCANLTNQNHQNSSDFEYSENIQTTSDFENEQSSANSEIQNSLDFEGSEHENSSDFEYEQETEDEAIETSDDEYVPVPPKTALKSKRMSRKPRKYSTGEYSSEYTSDSDEENQNPQVVTKRPQNRKADNIAHWLFKLLEKKSSAIGWTGKDREFKILDQKKLAKMWGDRKGNTNMTYNNVARTMRYHYKNSKGKELEIVNRKLVYRFSKRFLGPKI